MAWTTPINWVNGSVYGATTFNAQVRDNLLYLLNRPNARIKRTAGDYTISNTASFAAIDSANLKITLSLSGSAVLVIFSGVYNVGTNGQILYVDLQVDSALENNTTYGLWNSVYYIAAGGKVVVNWAHLVTGLSIGSHTFTPYAKVSTASTAGATLYASGTSPLFFGAVEVA